MEKRHAFILSLLITLLLIGNFYFFANKNHQRETVFVTRVIDGDTLEAGNEITIRLVNINTPEKNQPGYNEAKEFLSNFENTSVEIIMAGTDKYGRTLAKIYTPSYLNLEIVEKGLGTKFLVEESEIEQFSEAEFLAIEKELGIWKKSQYFGCIDSTINPETEIISLENNCEIVNLQNWQLKDESRKRYNLEESYLDKPEFRLSEENIWNNDRDTLYIFDSKNNLVHYNSYGY
jgi:endonuclease YncB( thermonuclease family)